MSVIPQVYNQGTGLIGSTTDGATIPNTVEDLIVQNTLTVLGVSDFVGQTTFTATVNIDGQLVYNAMQDGLVDQPYDFVVFFNNEFYKVVGVQYNPVTETFDCENIDCGLLDAEVILTDIPLNDTLAVSAPVLFHNDANRKIQRSTGFTYNPLASTLFTPTINALNAVVTNTLKLALNEDNSSTGLFPLTFRNTASQEIQTANSDLEYQPSTQILFMNILRSSSIITSTLSSNTLTVTGTTTLAAVTATIVNASTVNATNGSVSGTLDVGTLELDVGTGGNPNAQYGVPFYNTATRQLNVDSLYFRYNAAENKLYLSNFDLSNTLDVSGVATMGVVNATTLSATTISADIIKFTATIPSSSTDNQYPVLLYNDDTDEINIDAEIRFNPSEQRLYARFITVNRFLTAEAGVLTEELKFITPPPSATLNVEYPLCLYNGTDSEINKIDGITVNPSTDTLSAVNVVCTNNLTVTNSITSDDMTTTTMTVSDTLTVDYIILNHLIGVGFPNTNSDLFKVMLWNNIGANTLNFNANLTYQPSTDTLFTPTVVSSTTINTTTVNADVVTSVLVQSDLLELGTLPLNGDPDYYPVMIHNPNTGEVMRSVNIDYSAQSSRLSLRFLTCDAAITSGAYTYPGSGPGAVTTNVDHAIGVYDDAQRRFQTVASATINSSTGVMTVPLLSAPIIASTTVSTTDVLLSGQLKHVSGITTIANNYIQIQTEVSALTFGDNLPTPNSSYGGGNYLGVPTTSPKRAFGNNFNAWVISSATFLTSEWSLGSYPSGCWKIDASLTYQNTSTTERHSPTMRFDYLDGASTSSVSFQEPTYARMTLGMMTRVKTSAVIYADSATVSTISIRTGLNIDGTTNFQDSTPTTDFDVTDFEIRFQYLGNNPEYNTT